MLVAIAAWLGGASGPIDWALLIRDAPPSRTSRTRPSSLKNRTLILVIQAMGTRTGSTYSLMSWSTRSMTRCPISTSSPIPGSRRGWPKLSLRWVSAERGLRGANYSPWDTLKRYDARVYPQNGSWNGWTRIFTFWDRRPFSPAASPLHPQLSSRIRASSTVSSPQRSGTKRQQRSGHCSPSIFPIRQRLDLTSWYSINDYLQTHGITSATPGFYTPSPPTFPAIEALVAGPGATIEGQPLRTWLARQPFLKGPASQNSYAFIDVANPENLDLTRSDQVTVYAIYAVNDLPNVLPFPDRGELPAKNCSVRFEVRDVVGDLRALATGTTDGGGAFAVRHSLVRLWNRAATSCGPST